MLVRFTKDLGLGDWILGVWFILSFSVFYKLISPRPKLPTLISSSSSSSSSPISHLPIPASAAPLPHDAHALEAQPAVDGLAHIDDGQAGADDAGQGLHLDARLGRRVDEDGDADAAVRREELERGL